MVATAPETVGQDRGPGWLDPFLAQWHPGSGELREVREPATGRHLLSVAQSTTDDVRRATESAAAAQAVLSFVVTRGRMSRTRESAIATVLVATPR